MVMKSGVVSLPCPQCQGKLRVTDSRPGKFWGGDSVRRKRVCESCGHRHSTYEVSLDALDNFAERLHALGRAIVASTEDRRARNYSNGEANSPADREGKNG